MSRLSLHRRFPTASISELADACARLVAALEDDFKDLLASFLRRPTRARDTVTTASARPFLKLDELTIVDTTNGNVTVYLPEVGANDVGRRCAFVKSVAANAVTAASNTQRVHNTTSVGSMTDQGVHALEWDGSSWWRHRG